MLVDAGGLLADGVARQGLYLAYAIRTAFQVEGAPLSGRVRKDVIERELARVKCAASRLSDVFMRLDDLARSPATRETAARAHWALTYAIGIYMFRMLELNLKRCEAHRELIRLIDATLAKGVAVDVIDFNWDCLVERVWSSYAGYGFGWDCGRDRRGRVIEGTGREPELPLTELVNRQNFRRSPPLDDERTYGAIAGLIKPHGDMCTFLRGASEVFYCGGRHGQTTVGLFPKWLRDVRHDDRYVRSSVMPPADCRFRHEHRFFHEEVERLVTAISESDVVVIIGWSASGPDEWYGSVFERALRRRSNTPPVRIIDLKDDEMAKAELKSRVMRLFERRSTLDAWWEGFRPEAVRWLQQSV